MANDTLLIQVVDSASHTVSATFTIPINPAPLTITTASPLPAGKQATAYSQPIRASGGVLPYTWSLVSQTGSNGWIVSSTGFVIGTPTTAETDSLTIKVTDAASNSMQAVFSLTVTTNVIYVPPTITTSSPLPNATVGTAYNFGMSVINGTSPFTWVITSGVLPTGLSFSSSGFFSGTPSATGTVTLGIKVTDAHPTTVGPQNFSLTVNPASVSTNIKWKPGFYVMTRNDGQQAASFAAAASTPKVVGVAGWYGWDGIENNTLGVYSWTQLFNDFLALQVAFPGAFFCPMLNWFFIGGPTHTSISSGYNPTGGGIPNYILQGSAATYGAGPAGNTFNGWYPDSYNSAGGVNWNSGTTYTNGQEVVAPNGISYTALNVGGNLNKQPPNASFWSENKYAFQHANLCNANVVNRLIALYQNFATQIVPNIPGAPQYNGLTVDQHPLFTGIGTSTPTDINMINSLDIPANYTFAAQNTGYQALTAIQQYYKQTVCFLQPGFGGNSFSGSNDPTAQNALLLAMFNAGMGTSATDVTVATPANLSYGQNYFIGNNFNGTTGFQPTYVNRMGAMFTSQGHDYGINGGNAPSDASVSTLINTAINTLGCGYYFMESYAQWNFTGAPAFQVQPFWNNYVKGAIAAAPAINTTVPSNLSAIGINGQWFASNSVWNQPIPAGSFTSPFPNSAGSAAVISQWQAQGWGTAFNSANSTFSGGGLVVAPGGQPTINLQFKNPTNSNTPYTIHNVPLTGNVLATAITQMASLGASGDTDQHCNIFSTDDQAFFNFYAFHPAQQFTATGCSISGTTLTIGTVTSGTVAASFAGNPSVIQSIGGGSIAPGTRILSNISGSGNGSTWLVDISQTVGSTTTTGTMTTFLVCGLFPIAGAGWWDGSQFPAIGSAAGACQMGGSIRASEWAAGVIPHALCGAIGDVVNGNGQVSANFIYPATTSDGFHGNLCEGARLQLDPTLSDATLLGLGVASAMLPVCHAMQTYGWYLMDMSSSTFAATIHYVSTATGASYPGAASLPNALLPHINWVNPPVAANCPPLETHNTTAGSGFMTQP